MTGAPDIGEGFVLLAIATAVLELNMFDATRQWIGPLARLKFKHSDLSILERGIEIQLRKVSFLISKVALKLYESKTCVRNSRTLFDIPRVYAKPLVLRTRSRSEKPAETARYAMSLLMLAEHYLRNNKVKEEIGWAFATEHA